MTASETTATIIFDGECVLCSCWVGFLIERDPNRQFHFAAMQSSAGRDILLQADLDPDDPSSFVFLRHKTVCTNTDAIITVLQQVGGLATAAGFCLSLLPRPIRDWFYVRIARNRYRLFGKRDHCYVPAPEDRGRFLS